MSPEDIREKNKADQRKLDGKIEKLRKKKA
jgi:hypothetical protein